MIYFRVKECVNPKGEQGVAYACAKETAGGHITLLEMAEEICEMTSMTEGDVKGIISAYIYQIAAHILQGSRVEMHSVGTFYPSISGRCFKKELITSTGFRPTAYIDDVTVRFRPLTALNNEFKVKASFKRLPSDLMA